jgi:peptidoglycan/LPS O-acetylase OafA/YrhL
MRIPTLADIAAPDRNSFGVVRLVLALAVLISHSFWFATGSSANEPLYAITGYSLGEHAVQAFFILSGFLVAQSLARSGDVLDFAVARTLRIFPGLIVCVLATSLGLGLLVTSLPPTAYLTDKGLWLYLAKTLTLTTGAAQLPGVFETLPVAGLFNGSLWTLKYEVCAYAVLALLGAFGLLAPRMRATVSLVVAALTLGAAAALHKFGAAEGLLPNSAYFTVFFSTGVLFFLLRDLVRLNWVAASALFVIHAVAIGTPFQILATTAAVGYAMFLLASVSFGRLTHWTRTNDLSFGLYIYAAPIQQALIHALPGIDPLSLTAASLACVWPCAWLSWRWIERPALGGRRTIVSRLSHLAAINPRTDRASKSYRHARGSWREASPGTRSAPRYGGRI